MTDAQGVADELLRKCFLQNEAGWREWYRLTNEGQSVGPPNGMAVRLRDAITAALDAGKPQWTTQRPKAGGWYWYRGDGVDERIIFLEFRGLALCAGGDEFARPIHYLTGEWSSTPIAPPGEKG